MTSDRQYVIWSVLVTLFVGLFLGGFETALWPKLFGFLPTPLSWFCVIVHLALNRSKGEGFSTSYLFAAVVSVFTSAAAGILIFLSAIAFLGIRSFRTRIYWPGLGYYVMACTLAVPAFHLAHYAVSWVAEEHAITHVPIFHWIGQMGTTALMAVVLYYVLGFLDHVIRPEAVAEETMGTAE